MVDKRPPGATGHFPLPPDAPDRLAASSIFDTGDSATKGCVRAAERCGSALRHEGSGANARPDLEFWP
eukprot:465263-Prymnesium_polylepis.1